MNEAQSLRIDAKEVTCCILPTVFPCTGSCAHVPPTKASTVYAAMTCSNVVCGMCGLTSGCLQCNQLARTCPSPRSSLIASVSKVPLMESVKVRSAQGADTGTDRAASGRLYVALRASSAKASLQRVTTLMRGSVSHGTRTRY